MTNDKVWAAYISRAELLPVLLGRAAKYSLVNLPLDKTVGDDEIIVLRGLDDGKPDALIVADHKVEDFFAWIETYGPQFFPITQSVRLLTWKHVGTLVNKFVSPQAPVLAHAYAGLIVGEILSLSSDPLKLLDKGVSLQLAQGAYSYPIARAALIWGVDSKRHAISTGAQQLERMGLLGDRRLRTDDLAPLWQLVEGNALGLDPVWSLISEALECIRMDREIQRTIAEALEVYFKPAAELAKLPSMSAEQRVHVLDQILESASRSRGGKEMIVAAFCAAHVAVEIGGGTTRHMNLIVDFAKKAPLVWTFFGLVASVGKVDKWQSKFGGFARLVERDLNYTFALFDAPRSDLSVHELLSISSNSSKAVFIDLPRAQSRVLSVELYPGCSMNVSLAGKLEEREPSAVVSPSLDLARLDEALAILWNFRESLLVSGKSKDQIAELGPGKPAVVPKKKRTRVSRGSSKKLL